MHDKGILDVAAMPVLTVNDPSSELSPEYGSTSTFQVPQTGTTVGLGNGVQILQRRPSRYKAVVAIAISAFANGATGVVFSHRLDDLSNPNNPQGFTVAVVPYSFQWENQSPLYAVALGGGPVPISVIDQAAAASVAVLPEQEVEGDLSWEGEMESGFVPETRAGNSYR